MQHIQINFSDDTIILRLSLARINFLSLQEKIFLTKNLDSSSSLALSSIEELENLLGRKIKLRKAWNGQENLRLAKAAAFRCNNLKIDLIFYEDPDYPELLRQISDPPYLLFSRGNSSILSGPSVSVVGTRKITGEGRSAARQFAYDAVMAGCNVVSGLASGVDGVSHQGAVDCWFDADEKGLDVSKIGRTIAVLPSAIDSIVPYGNRKLAEKILLTGGCLISEYEPGMEMANFHFVGRNRIIAGLSPATVVIEAPAGSGALITADFALDYNRDVLFHQVAFGQMAEKVSDMVTQELEEKFANGQVSKYKVENRPEKFVKAGAPIIKDYKDYCKAREEMPGIRSVKIEQGSLFED